MRLKTIRPYHAEFADDKNVLIKSKTMSSSRTSGSRYHSSGQSELYLTAAAAAGQE